MTVFDFAALTIVGLSLLLGLWRGVVSEILAILVWVMVFVAVKYGAGPVSGLMTWLSADPTLCKAGAMVSIAIAVLIAGTGVRLLAKGFIQAIGMGWIDRLLGSAFGLLRGVLILLVAVLFGGMTKLPGQTWWKEAVLAPPLETAVIAVKIHLPADLAARVHFH